MKIMSTKLRKNYTEVGRTFGVHGKDEALRGVVVKPVINHSAHKLGDELRTTKV